MITSRCNFLRHFSTVTQQTPFLTEHFCTQILDTYPDLKTLKNLHRWMISDDSLRSNPSLCVKLMRSYAFHGDLRSTRHLFDEIPERNVIFFNVMIRSYVNNQCYKDAILVFKLMSMYENVVRPDHYTYPCVLKACSWSENLMGGVQIHAAVLKIGLNWNLFIGNGLIAMYGKCGCLIEARRVLDEMTVKDVVSWNSMVAGYAQNGKFDDALEVCREMELRRVKADAGTMASLLPAVTNTSSENVMFVKEMFSKLANKGLVPWNVMIAVYVNNAMNSEALDLYSQMEPNRIDPDAVTIASVLPACGDLSALSLGRQIHRYVETKSLRPNLSLENALIDMYAKCGCLQEARDAFDTMQTRDVVSWTSMILAYGVNGKGNDAVDLFSKMTGEGLTPDSILFVTIMSACSHSGMLNEGRNYYRLMTEEYKIAPRLEHYACMVDLLARAGLVDEAFSFIKQMSVEPNERIWGTLLGACRVYSNMEIGVITADRLFEMVPEQAGYYVLLSNIYAKAGKFDAVTAVRSMMKSKGIKKTPGISNVELRGRVYTFRAGDQSHPRSKEIYEELSVLVAKMREAGYVPENDSALHDVEEEDKEFHLAVHSEKLAIVFALISTKAGELIRITKNLRVCGDCHVAIKLISKISEREIIVRDTNRFHIFKNGICSCGDYW